MDKKKTSVMGLVLITVLASLQYFFLWDVSESVSAFAFLCVANGVGALFLILVRFKSLSKMRKSTWIKGLLLAAEIVAFYQLLFKFRYLSAEMLSGTVSLFFLFVTPLLYLFRKRMKFFSAAATAIAGIALLLIFDIDPVMFFVYGGGWMLLGAAVLLACYIVSTAVLGENEDSSCLAFSQVFFSAVISLAGWWIRCGRGKDSFSLPSSWYFWILVLFFGIGIYAFGSIVQISSQKGISATVISLIISSQAVMVLFMNRFVTILPGREEGPLTVFQLIGSGLFIAAVLMMCEPVMRWLGYTDTSVTEYVDENGKTRYHSSVSRKMVFVTLLFSMVSLGLTAALALGAVQYIQDEVLYSAMDVGMDASDTSSEAMIAELENNMTKLAEYKAGLAEEKLTDYSSAVRYTVSYAEELYKEPGLSPYIEVEPPDVKNGGIWTMQRVLADENVSYEEIKEEIGLLGNMIDVFEPVSRTIKSVASIYIGTESGAYIVYDRDSDSIEDVDSPYFEFREREWYQQAKTAGRLIFTGAYLDGYGRGLIITCASPVKGPDGKLVGCIGMDVQVDDLYYNMVNEWIEDPSAATLIDTHGNILACKDLNPRKGEKMNIMDPDRDDALKKAGKQILAKKEGILEVASETDPQENTEEEADLLEAVGTGTEYVAFSTIRSTSWKICIVCPAYSALEPVTRIRDDIQESMVTVADSLMDTGRQVLQSCLLLIALILILILLVVGRISRKITDPIKKLEQDVDEISQGNFDQRTLVETDDEIGNLAKSFNSMAESLQKYIVDLKEVTAKEERIAMELSLAARIQADMLPRKFPAFPDRKEIDIYATMTPAKEVGGDFYDFFLPDENHIALVMADVSGKGVPASLFMMIAKTLIKNRTQMADVYSPAAILKDVNEQLCENNDEQLFVTVWLAILDLTTGKGVAANAGHEHPALRKAGGDFELVKYRHSLALAIMGGVKFQEREFELQPGDSLYVYTDGVTEAVNNVNELFGETRLVNALNKKKDVSAEELLKTVQEEINAFAGNTEQFDDITMLAFTWKGKQ